MFSLLIAEDEAWMRELLLQTVAWESCGITRLFEAGNGTEALSVLKSERVDFVLSDIRMPGLTGLELLEEANRSGAETEFVMLSGFDDFDYVRGAMRMGARDYLLKPVEEEELLHLFRGLARHKSERRSDDARLSVERYAIRQSRGIVREKFMGDWLTGKVKDPGLVRHRSLETGLVWEGGAYVMLLVEPDRRPVLAKRYSERDMELLQYAARNMMEELLDGERRRHYGCPIEDRLAFWCAAEADAGGDVAADGHPADSALGALLDTFRQKVKEYLKMSVSIGISRLYEDAAEAPSAYMEAVHSLKLKPYLGGDYTCYFGDGPPESARDAEAAAGGRKSKLIADILDYIGRNYDKDISLHAVAERFYVNASYLSRLFKEETGTIFTRYLMELRLARAKELLADTHLKIYEISAQVGYDDVKYFNKIFKSTFAVTPADYRNGLG